MNKTTTQDKFADIFIEGGHSNALGRTEEVVQTVLQDRSRLEELYSCLFVDDAWQRMRAVDALEKVCRAHSEWLEPYLDRMMNEVAISSQPSIQWHLAQIFGQINLTQNQKEQALEWMTKRLQTIEVDWIVAANCMKTLMQFVERGEYSQDQLIELLQQQQGHHSKTVVRLATKLLRQFPDSTR